ncbi:tabersonine 16-hydroxylase 1-like [Coffea arabica]|uniref:Tabersonine 16-hydroxylase 1-like n=1 Tax=Coffea arabica TaxID=13443 RepID=A0A6P6V2X3_COFAR|nr:tabersonine 16-hydroxylase 1-like [Coffea arabica]
MAKEIFKTRLAFKVTSYNFSDIMFSPYGKYWKELRKICNMELLSSVHSACKLSNRLEKMSITSRAAFEKRNKDTEKFIQLIDETSSLASGFSLADMYPSIKLLQKVEVGKQDGGGGREDLVDVLLNIQKSGDFERLLADANIKAVILRISLCDVNARACGSYSHTLASRVQDIFAAGSEASATAMEWAISQTIRNPKIMKRAQNEARSIFNDKGNVDESTPS